MNQSVKIKDKVVVVGWMDGGVLEMLTMVDIHSLSYYIEQLQMKCVCVCVCAYRMCMKSIFCPRSEMRKILFFY